MMMQAELMREDSRLSEPNVLWLRVVGRMKPGVSVAQAAERTTELFRQVVREDVGSAIAPEVEAEISKKTIEIAPFGKGFSFLRARYERPLILLAVVVGLVLVIACANVGNLFMARASERHREVALRLAVGSSRKRMLRQLLTESLMLSLLGGAVGLIVASWAIDFLLVLISSRGTGVPIEASLDGRVLVFTFFVSCLAAVLFGLAPAFHTARVELSSSLKNQAAVSDARHQSWNLRRVLVVSQVAVSLALLIGAGLFLRSLENLRNVDVGFPADEVLQVEVDAQGAGYGEEQLPGLYRELVERIGAIAEVRSASMSLFPLFTTRHWNSELVVDGFEAQSSSDTSFRGNMVTPGYFETVGIPLVAGRGFEWRDGEGASLVSVVNETMARHFFPGESPVGKTFRLDDDPSSPHITIVGMVEDLIYDDFRDETPRLVYFPVMQLMIHLTSIEVRAAVDPASVAPQVRQAVRDVSDALPILSVMPAGERVGRSLRQENLLSKLTGFFGLLALLLAAIGLYGVMAHGVVQRTNEIGIRMALGAARSHVVWMIVKDAVWMVVLGVVIGVAVSLAGTRLVASLLYDLSATDPVTILGAIVFLAAVAVSAGYLPARRASRMDPLRALRYE
jgi:predicted permease